LSEDRCDYKGKSEKSLPRPSRGEPEQGWEEKGAIKEKSHQKVQKIPKGGAERIQRESRVVTR